VTANYPPPIDKLLTLGDPRDETNWPDYLALGISAEHVPDLIRMTLDEELRWADSESKEVWANLHAWRALGQLRAQAAIEPLLQLLPRIDEDEDDWVDMELPKVYGMIGPAALPALVKFLANKSNGLYAHTAAASSIKEIAKWFPVSRADCVAAIARQMERFAENDPALNGFLLADLLDLGAVEAAPVIQRAFAAKRIDESIAGDWEDVQIEFKMKNERTAPRAPTELSETMNRIAGMIDTLTSPRGEQPRRIETPNDSDEIVDSVISRMLASGELKLPQKPQPLKTKKKK
jgi:hypothetical protein